MKTNRAKRKKHSQLETCSTQPPAYLRLTDVRILVCNSTFIPGNKENLTICNNISH